MSSNEDTPLKQPSIARIENTTNIHVQIKSEPMSPLPLPPPPTPPPPSIKFPPTTSDSNPAIVEHLQNSKAAPRLLLPKMSITNVNTASALSNTTDGATTSPQFDLRCPTWGGSTGADHALPTASTDTNPPTATAPLNNSVSADTTPISPAGVYSTGVINEGTILGEITLAGKEDDEEGSAAGSEVHSLQQQQQPPPTSPPINNCHDSDDSIEEVPKLRLRRKYKRKMKLPTEDNDFLLKKETFMNSRSEFEYHRMYSTQINKELKKRFLNKGGFKSEKIKRIIDYDKRSGEQQFKFAVEKKKKYYENKQRRKEESDALYRKPYTNAARISSPPHPVIKKPYLSGVKAAVAAKCHVSAMTAMLNSDSPLVSTGQPVELHDTAGAIPLVSLLPHSTPLQPVQYLQHQSQQLIQNMQPIIQHQQFHFLPQAMQQQQQTTPVQYVQALPDNGHVVTCLPDTNIEVLSSAPEFVLPTDVIRRDAYALQWPGLESLAVCILDPSDGKVYGNGYNMELVPSDRHFLTTSMDTRIVAIHDIVTLFPEECRDDAKATLLKISTISSNNNIVVSKTNGRMYIRLNTLMAFIALHPWCDSLQQTRGCILQFLMRYAETQCWACGFIRRDCKCGLNLKYGGMPKTVKKYASITLDESPTLVGISNRDSWAQTDSLYLPNYYSIAIPKPGAVKSPTSKILRVSNPVPPNLQMDTNQSQKISSALPLSLSVSDQQPVPKQQPSSIQTKTSTVASNKSIIHMIRLKDKKFIDYTYNEKKDYLLRCVYTQVGGVITKSIMTQTRKLSREKRCKSTKEITSNIHKKPDLEVTTNKDELMNELIALNDGDNTEATIGDITHNVADKDTVKEPETPTARQILWKLIDDSDDDEETSATPVIVTKEPSTEEMCSQIVNQLIDSVLDTKLKVVEDKETTAEVEKPSQDVPNKEEDIGNKQEDITSVNIADIMDSSKTDTQPAVDDDVEMKDVNNEDNKENDGTNKIEDTPTIKSDSNIDISSNVEVIKPISTETDIPSKTPLSVVTMSTFSDIPVSNSVNNNVPVSNSVNNDISDSPSVTAEVNEPLITKTANSADSTLCSESKAADISSDVNKSINQSTTSNEVHSSISAVNTDIEMKDDTVASDPKQQLINDDKLADTTVNKDNSDLDQNDNANKNSIVIEEDKKKEEAAAVLASLSGILGSPKSLLQAPQKKTKNDLITIDLEKSSKKVDESDTNLVKPSTKIMKCFNRYEYLHTGEKLFKCISQATSQCFDTRIAAQYHTIAHAFKNNDEDGNAYRTQEEKCSLFCQHCDFKVASNRWFDLLRHLKENHYASMTSIGKLTGAKNSMNSVRHGCYLCGLSFTSNKELEDHMDYHYNSRYKCIYCGLVLSSWKHVQLHVSKECEQASKPAQADAVIYLGCPFCPLVFHKKSMRMLHALSHTDTGMTCLFCRDDIPFEVWRHLRRHYQNRHASRMDSGKPLSLTFPPTRPQTPYCNTCKMDFRITSDFNSHVLNVHDLIPYISISCDLCDKMFRNLKVKEKHVKKVHMQDLRCPKCVYIAQTIEQRKRHIATEHREETHLCSECDKTFFTFSELKQHMVGHTTNSTYPCRMCGVELKSARELRRHKTDEHSQSNVVTPASIPRTLSQEEAENTICSQCQYKCYSSKALIKHMLRRHGIPPKAAPYDPVTSSSSALISAAKKRLAIAERKVVGKGKKRGPKPGPRTPKAAEQNYHAYNHAKQNNDSTVFTSPVQLPGIPATVVPPVEPTEPPEPAEPLTDQETPDEAALFKMRKSFGCARIRTFEHYLRKKNAAKEVETTTLNPTTSTPHHIGRPRMRRKCQQVDMDHCYSMPNEAPMRNSADVLRSSGFYQTRLLRKMKHSTDEDTASADTDDDDDDDEDNDNLRDADNDDEDDIPAKRLKLDHSADLGQMSHNNSYRTMGAAGSSYAGGLSPVKTGASRLRPNILSSRNKTASESRPQPPTTPTTTTTSSSTGQLNNVSPLRTGNTSNSFNIIQEPSSFDDISQYISNDNQPNNSKDIEIDFLRNSQTDIADDEFKAILDTMETSPQRSFNILNNSLIKTPTKKALLRENHPTALRISPGADTSFSEMDINHLEIDNEMVEQILRDVGIDNSTLKRTKDANSATMIDSVAMAMSVANIGEFSEQLAPPISDPVMIHTPQDTGIEPVPVADISYNDTLATPAANRYTTTANSFLGSSNLINTMSPIKTCVPFTLSSSAKPVVKNYSAPITPLNTTPNNLNITPITPLNTTPNNLNITPSTAMKCYPFTIPVNSSTPKKVTPIRQILNNSTTKVMNLDTLAKPRSISTNISTEGSRTKITTCQPFTLSKVTRETQLLPTSTLCSSAITTNNKIVTPLLASLAAVSLPLRQVSSAPSTQGYRHSSPIVKEVAYIAASSSVDITSTTVPDYSADILSNQQSSKGLNHTDS